MRYCLAVLLGSVLFFVEAQQSVPRLTASADELYDNHRYLEAIPFYAKISGIDKKNYRATYRLGNCYLESRQYPEAEETFARLGAITDTNNNYRSQALYKFAAMLKTDYRFKEADSLFAFTISISDDQELIKLARKQKEGCVLALRQEQVDKGFSIASMEEINSKFHDFGAIINPSNGQLVFATTRNLGGVQYQGSQFSGVLPDLTSYEWNRNRWRENGNAQRFSRLNSEWSEGSGSFTKDGNTFYFSSCEGEGSSDCTILVSYLEDGRWTAPEPLNDYINEKGSENKQPAISATGDTLFFSSDRTGGYGGSDIWMSLRGIEPESWGPAINMGDEINSSEDDITPYFSSAYNCLIFASNGHVGYGGHDLYAAKGESFFEPELFNLSYPFNSPLDDTYFNIFDSLGFIASNREDRQNLNLYSFSVSSEKLFLSLLISGESLIDSQVISRFRDIRSIDLFAFRVEDYQGYELFAPEKRIKPKPSILENDGGVASSQTAQPEPISTENDYGPERKNYGNPLIQGRSPYSLEYEHVYFKYGSWRLSPTAKKAIEDMVIQLEPQKVNSIEILAYTDVDGSSDFNYKLSENRGESVRQYMIELGIPADFIQVRPRGEGPLSSRESWYSKMFSRRAEIVINGNAPVSMKQAKPYAVRYEKTVNEIEEMLGLSDGQLATWNTFNRDTIKAGTIVRIGNELSVIPNIKFFLEEDDLRNSFFVYTVKPNESLASIANKYNTLEELIAEVNNLDSELKEGDEIFIYKMK